MPTGIDTSSYSNALTKPINPLEMAGQYQGIANAMQQNRLLQQELPLLEARTQAEQQTVQQQQIATKQAQDIQGAMADLQNYKKSDGGYDYNSWMSNSVAPKHSLAMQTAFDIRNKNIGSLVAGTTDTQGNPVARTPESIATGSGMGNNANQSTNGQQASSNASGIFPAGLPADPLEQRGYFKERQAAGDSAQKDIAPLENVYGILQKHPDDQGTVLGAWNTYLAQHNIPVANSAAEAIQLTKDHAAQLQVNTNSPTDKARFDQEMANLNPNDLGGSLKRMIPYLIGTRAMAADQAQILHKAEPGGINATNIGNTRSALQPLSDPRIYELQWLAKNNPEAYKERVGSLSDIERAEITQMAGGLKKLKNPNASQ